MANRHLHRHMDPHLLRHLLWQRFLRHEIENAPPFEAITTCKYFSGLESAQVRSLETHRRQRNKRVSNMFRRLLTWRQT